MTAAHRDKAQCNEEDYDGDLGCSAIRFYCIIPLESDVITLKGIKLN